MVVTATLLMYTSTASDGTPMMFAVDKQTGERVGAVELPEKANYGMMTYVHEGKQYVIAQTGRTLTAMALYE
jgi:quinoprotein glucose dehydrogenase